MITTLPFARDHTVGAVAHPTQARHQHMLDDPSRFSALWPDTMSIFDGDLIAIGGAVRTEGGIGGWGLFTDKITPRLFMPVHRRVLRVLRRMEREGQAVFAHIDPSRREALRWSGLLGLEAKETELLPDGRRFMRVESHV